MTAPEPRKRIGWDDVTNEDFITALLDCQEQLKQALDEAAELRTALADLAGSYVTNKVPHDNLWNMLVRTEVLERARAALAASEGSE